MKQLYKVTYQFTNAEGGVRTIIRHGGGNTPQDAVDQVCGKDATDVTILSVKPMEPFIQITSFAPNWDKSLPEDQRGKCTDKSKVWAQLHVGDSQYPLGGYIDNLFGLTEIDRDNPVTFNVQLGKIVFREASNGGRTNTKCYDTIEAYYADPQVKQNYIKSQRGGIFSYLGEPARVDLMISFMWNGYAFSLDDHLYDTVPFTWYSDAWQDVGEELAKLDCYTSADDYRANNSTTDDLFGQRYFPVIRFPKELAIFMEDHCGYFKNHSGVIFNGDYGYIGIRSKPDEIWELDELYNEGAVVLKGRDWDWS